MVWTTRKISADKKGKDVFPLATTPFVTDQLKNGSLIEIAPGIRLSGCSHGISTSDMEHAEPILKQIVGWFCKEAHRLPANASA